VAEKMAADKNSTFSGFKVMLLSWWVHLLAFKKPKSLQHTVTAADLLSACQRHMSHHFRPRHKQPDHLWIT